MSLRLQLLAVGLLTLVLPWTGLRYVQEMEAALRAGLEQSLLARAATVAAALEQQDTAFCSPASCAQRLGAAKIRNGGAFCVKLRIVRTTVPCALLRWSSCSTSRKC